jgi:hypothetical protein
LTRRAPARERRRGLLGDDGGWRDGAPAQTVLQVRHEVTHRAKLLQIWIGDLDVEFLFDLEHQLDGVKRIQSQILAQGLLEGNCLRIALELTGERTADLLGDGCR